MAPEKAIIVTATAQKQRLAILEYWFERIGTIDYSARLAEGFEHCLSMLAKFPYMGHLIKENNLRAFVYQNYQIIYEIREMEIVVHQFWDGRQHEY